MAAAMSICGGGIGGFAQYLVDIPIRTFHGLCDQTVDPIESLQKAKAVNKAGGYAELILYPHLAHDCWTTVYSDDRNFDWMFAFTTERDKTLEDKISLDHNE